MKAIELLAPAKDYEAAVAAVDFGADALYIGGAKFGARQAAGNSIEDIARVVSYAHSFGVRVHATLNTLLRDEELESAEAQARELIAAGVDALIVQDMALRRMNLPVELHASTQMATMTPEQAHFLGEVGFSRVILERALSLAEIKTTCAATTADVECFVHGAICVGYSGRCFLSRSLCARSGNRGACSQPCRLPWDLTDARGKRYLAAQHLLSVQDMNLSRRLGELLDAGVTSFKIEGRLKDTNYIRNVVAYYRRAVDQVLSSRPHLCRASIGESVPDFTPDTSKSFTRGESEYFFDGKCAGVASFDTPKSVGEYLGRVTAVTREGFRLDVPHNVVAGDGLCLRSGGVVFGTYINAVEGMQIIPDKCEGIRPGVEVYRNFDRRFTKLVAASRTRRVIPVTATVTATALGVELAYTDCEGLSGSVRREMSLEVAKNPDANGEALRMQATKGGDTIFSVRHVTVTGARWFVPISIAAELRREALAKLFQARQAKTTPRAALPEGEARYPSDCLTAEENVTNRLAEAFYRDHGVREIEWGLDLVATTAGRRVMRSAYCLRREIGECLKENPALRGELYLERGAKRYRLEFDCVRCEMNVLDATKE